MRWIFTVLFLFFSCFQIQSQSAGDIAFLSFNADGDDYFQFYTLVDIPASTTIYFTDNGWYAAGGFRGFEGVISWSPSSNVAAGTIVGRNEIEAEWATISGDFNLAGGGDQILAYTGSSTSPTFLAAINNSGPSGEWQSDATSSNTSAIPTGLVNGENAVAITHIDNAKYQNGDLSGTAEEIRVALNDSNNWDGHNSNVQTYTGTIILPVDLAHFTVTARDKTAHLTWATASEVDNDYFLVEKSLDGKSFEAIGKVAGHGTTTREQQYSYEDHELYPMNYYRLKQVDYDGAHEYSKVITLEKSIGEDVHIINRTVRQSLQIDNGLTGQVTYTVLDLNGRTLSTGTLAPALNDIDVSSVPSGLFIVSIASAGQVISEKIRKL